MFPESMEANGAELFRNLAKSVIGFCLIILVVARATWTLLVLHREDYYFFYVT